jgi:hypothetical protein
MSDSDRLAEMLARADIHDALMRYCRGVDRRDPELLLSAFHDDAVDDHGRGEQTPQDLAAVIAAGDQRAMMHFIGNEFIEVDGDRAVSETYFISFQSVEHEGAPATRMRAGRYLDRFERRDGSWRIAHRRVVDEWSRVDLVQAVLPNLSSYVGVRSKEDFVYGLRDGWERD